MYNIRYNDNCYGDTVDAERDLDREKKQCNEWGKKRRKWIRKRTNSSEWWECVSLCFPSPVRLIRCFSISLFLGFNIDSFICYARMRPSVARPAVNFVYVFLSTFRSTTKCYCIVICLFSILPCGDTFFVDGETFKMHKTVWGKLWKTSGLIWSWLFFLI